MPSRSEWLNSPVTTVRGIGEWHAKRLKNLKIVIIRDLLRHFPSRYEDFSNIKTASEVKIGEICSVAVRVKKISTRRTWQKKIFLTEATLEDASGSLLRAVWFNQPFLTRNIRPETTITVAGKLTKDKYGLYFSNPAYEIGANEITTSRGNIAQFKHTSGLIPIYPETKGVTSRMLRYFIQPLLPPASQLPDILSAELRARTNLMSFGEAIREIHFPRSLEGSDQARRRFAFEDVLLLQLKFQLERIKKIKTSRAPTIPINIELIKKFTTTLPFVLTNAQRKATKEILRGMTSAIPMNRLLNGDVGSGKTVVATIASLKATTANWQTAILAPTEILARQHFKKISEMLASFPVKIALLTSAETHISEEGITGRILKETLVKSIYHGDPAIIIGTHALLQGNVKFGKLGLVIVDEQHRFGVKQRALLLRENARKTTEASTRTASDTHHSLGKCIPHLLSMSATPIPRTLALSFYGDLDISILNELPKGRQKIITRIVSPQSRLNTYKFIKREIARGRQVFVICPRIDPEDKYSDTNELSDWRVEIKAVKTEFEKLSKNIFPDARIAMLHGKMKPGEKESIMSRFVARKIDILVSTSVVEVGVDVPNATIMMVEGAERFGLAQLHQFRGRVGRGVHQSYCFLLTESSSRTVTKRLTALAESSDGFALAEKDLQIRGPGEFFGSKQSGLPDITMRGLADIELVQLAHQEATSLLKIDPELKAAPFLKERLASFEASIHLE